MALTRRLALLLVCMATVQACKSSGNSSETSEAASYDVICEEAERPILGADSWKPFVQHAKEDSCPRDPRAPSGLTNRPACHTSDGVDSHPRAIRDESGELEMVTHRRGEYEWVIGFSGGKPTTFWEMCRGLRDGQEKSWKGDEIYEEGSNKLGSKHGTWTNRIYVPPRVEEWRDGVLLERDGKKVTRFRPSTGGTCDRDIGPVPSGLPFWVVGGARLARDTSDAHGFQMWFCTPGQTIERLASRYEAELRDTGLPVVRSVEWDDDSHEITLTVINKAHTGPSVRMIVNGPTPPVVEVYWPRH